MTPAVTIIQMTREELAEIVRQELERHTERMTHDNGEEWSLKDVCLHYNV